MPELGDGAGGESGAELVRGSGHAPRSRRSWARFYAVQTLYSLEITGGDCDEAMVLCLSGNTSDGKPPRMDEGLYRSLTAGVYKEGASLDAALAPVLSRRGTERRPEHLLGILLRAGAWEILHCGETDVAVILSEYLNLAHYFGVTPGGSLLNATLDTFSRMHRGNDSDVGGSDSDVAE
ncbi:MAG: hypothetical protein OD811_04020 [Alphaproteobacteria bacterium]